MLATKFHTHTKQQKKIIVLYITSCIILDSKLEDKKIPAPNDRKHSLTLVSSLFLPEENFDLLGLLPNISTFPHFQRGC
jgi:hypothetical protein